MTGKVAVITGASEGIGAGLVAAYLRQGWAVVASARSIRPPEDPAVLAVEGDIADPATADRIIGRALERFGRIDTVVNNAVVFVSKPFTDYTLADYTLVVGTNLTGFFWVTPLTTWPPYRVAISAMARYAALGIRVNAVSPGIIQTPMHPPDSYQDLGGRLPPLGRPGQVRDVVDGVLFLESSSYITGEILHIDGGQTAVH